MIVVTGTKRSGTSMWMHVLVAAGLPHIGDRFPAGWGELLRDANPDGFYESELMVGINYRTNPHPLTGAYLAPQQTRDYAVKIFIPGLVRSDVAFLDRCIATVRDWRQYVASLRRVVLNPRAMRVVGAVKFPLRQVEQVKPVVRRFHVPLGVVDEVGDDRLELGAALVGFRLAH